MYMGWFVRVVGSTALFVGSTELVCLHGDSPRQREEVSVQKDFCAKYFNSKMTGLLHVNVTLM